MKTEIRELIEDTNIHEEDLKCPCGCPSTVIGKSDWGGHGIIYLECDCGRPKLVVWKKVSKQQLN